MKYEDLYRRGHYQPHDQEDIKRYNDMKERYELAGAYARFAFERSLFGMLTQYDDDLIGYILGNHDDSFYSRKTLKRFKRDIEFIKQELL